MIKKRIIAIFLSLALTVSLLPFNLFASADFVTAEVTNYSFAINKEGVTRLEAEDVDVTNYVISSDSTSKIVSRSDASGGKFLAAATGGTKIGPDYYFQFKFTLAMDAEIEMSVAYAQTEQKKSYSQELIKTYTYVIDGTQTVGLSSNYILPPRNDITQWETVTYDKFSLSRGEHTVKVHIAASGTGNPNIDYIDFNVSKELEPILTLDQEGITRLEAEAVDVTNYVISSDNSSKIVERADASGGKFLAAATGGTKIGPDYYFQFKFTLAIDAEIEMSAAYAQTEQKKQSAQELIKSYTYVIDGSKTVGLSSNYVLPARDDATQWETVTYDKFRLAKGVHTVKVHITASGAGNPNIDYFDFKVAKIDQDATLMLQNFDEYDDMSPADQTASGYTYAATSLISEHTDTGTGLKAEWVAEGNLKAGVHTFRPNGEWISKDFAQNSEFYTYLRFWVSNPAFCPLELTVRLYEGASNKAYFISTLGQLIRKDGTRLTIEAGNAAGHGEESSMTIPSAFEGWVVFELKGNRTLGSGSGRKPISDFADVNTLEIDVRRPVTTTSGDYYVLDDICLSNSTTGTLHSLEDDDSSGDNSNNPGGKLYSGIKNIIFMIGDGMGPNQIESAKKQLGSSLAMESMPVSGTVCTDNILGELTDSAAAGTALSTGVKTTNGTVAKDSNGSNLQTMLEFFAARNKLTGLITTSYLLDATPAAFGAHTTNRGNYTGIARGFFDNNISVLLGGGTDEFSASIRDFTTGQYISLTNYARQLGYSYVTNLDQLQSVTDGKVLGLFTPHYMNYENARPNTEPSIADMTEKAISLLSENQDGFFLMVEAGNIDHAGHANQLNNSIADTIAFSEAVEVALDFLENNPDTLIIVTADHETGGLTESNGSYFYTTSNHSRANVPYYVAGKGSDYFENLTDNTELSLKVRQAATELDAQWIADNNSGNNQSNNPSNESTNVPTNESFVESSNNSAQNNSIPITGETSIPIQAIILLVVVNTGLIAFLKKKTAN